MKKISTAIILFLTFSANLFAQWDPEYDFFTLKGGFSHSFFDAQPDSFAYNMLNTPYGNMVMIPASGYRGYKLGYHGGILFTHDMHNDFTGISIGAEYQIFGMSQKYQTVNGKYTLTEHEMIHTVAIPAYFKIGRKMFKNQRYLFIGMQYNFNLGMMQSQEASYSPTVRNIKMSDSTYMRKNWVGVLGFNYTVFNFELNYVFGGFVNRSYEVPMAYYEKPTVRPFGSFPKGLLIFKTSMTLPLNPWTTNSYYLIKRKLRRWLK
jgi:hypothetical protein